MKRKINRVGQNTLTVSLPSKWAKKYNLKAGNEIEIAEEDDCLLICGKGEPERIKKQVSVEFNKDLPNYIRSVISSYYIQGFDTIKVNFTDHKVFKSIQKATESLIGYEIIEHGKDSCIVKNMITELGKEFKPTLRKMISVVKTMNDTWLEDLKANKFENFDEIMDLSFTNWKFRDYCLRIIYKNNLFEEKNQFYSQVIWNIEKLSHNYRNIYRHCVKKKHIKKITKEIENYLKEINYHFDIFVKNLFSKNNFFVGEEVREKRYNLLDKTEELLNKNKYDNVIIAYLLLNLKRINVLNSPVITVNLELAK